MEEFKKDLNTNYILILNIKMRVIENFVRYEAFVLIGILMATGTLIKLLGFYDFSSDWFWFLAGVGLMVEGCILMVKQRKFDKKYRIVEMGKHEK